LVEKGVYFKSGFKRKFWEPTGEMIFQAGFVIEKKSPSMRIFNGMVQHIAVKFVG
jgi:hypothetical protein